MVKVSILIPIYNAEAYLKECIQSVVTQTLEDIEIICINDGSTDNSAQIVKMFSKRDKRIKLINKENSGYGHTMNVGLSAATGEYIGIVESDDFASKDMFEALYGIAHEKNLDAVGSDCYLFRTDEIEDKKYLKIFSDSVYGRIIHPLEEKEILLWPYIWTSIYKKDFLEKNNLLFNETPGASYQDTSFVFKARACATSLYIKNEAFLNYRINNVDSSVHSSTKIFCICDEFEEIARFLDVKFEKNKRVELATILLAKKYMAYKWNYNRLSIAYRYAFLLKMQDDLAKEVEFCRQWNKDIYEFLNAKQKKELCMILDDCDVFFQATTNTGDNDNLSLSSPLALKLNMLAYKNGILSIINKYQQIVIYGAAKIAERVRNKMISENMDTKIIGYAVTKYGGAPKEIGGKRVCEIKEYTNYKKDVLILIAVSDKYQVDIYKTLYSNGFENILSINSEVLKATDI
ncbi:glycosyltransferase family 2 protein [Desulfobacter curvatus]|uniref:glycosyltransferase family 2 protein n=1 Tax=Desulfobacter curvatus TaxID=2290 RepID=UPI00037CA24E|nr:glycosyltransferase [Desulfobacter curvatus]